MASERSQELSSLVVVGAGLFSLAAMATYRETVLAEDAAAWSNVCGAVGHSLARALLFKLGYAAFLVPVALLAEGVRLFRRGASRPLVVRLLGILLFVPVLAACLADFLGGRSEWIPDPGGEVGIALAALFERQSGLGLVGGRIALLVLLAITFVLFADLLYSRTAAAIGKWIGAHGGEWVATLPWSSRSDAKGSRSSKASRRGRRSDDEDDDEESDDPAGARAGRASKESKSAKKSAAAAAASNAELDEELEKSLAATGDDATDSEDASDAAAADDDATSTSATGAGETEGATGKRRTRKKKSESGETAAASDDATADAGSLASDDESVVEPTVAAAAADAGAKPKKKLLAKLVDKVKEANARRKLDAKLAKGAAAKLDDAASAELEAEAGEVGDDESGAVQLPLPLITPARKPPQMQSTGTPTPEAPALRTNQPYQFPPIHLLDPPERGSGDFLKFSEEAARKLTTALKSFKIEARVVGVQHGPSITMLEVELAPGTKLTRLRALEDDLAMVLAAQSVRIIAPIPGKSTAGIEIPNETREIVRMSELLQWQGWNPQKYAIPTFLGKDSSGAPRIEDLAKMPHLLVAGSTGSGKSVCLNTLIMSILFTRTPEQVKLILIDPKMVELSSFQNVPHLMCPVVTDMKRAAGILEWAVGKMEERYALLHQVGVRNIYAYNKLGDDEVRTRLGTEFGADFETTLPFIVIVMDEMADLMLSHGKDVEQSITRLAQKSRAVGIHVILATQRPSTNVITGLIKANLPTRMAFKVTSKIDSRVILDQNGADKLLGQGDMLYVPPGSADLARVQGCFVTDQEIRDVVEFLAKLGPPSYSRELVQKKSTSDRDPSEVDEMYDDAAKFVVETQRGSASLLQRRFAIGYTRASRLIDLMAADGLLGEFNGSQAREVLVPTLEELDQRRGEQRAARGVKPAKDDDHERPGHDGPDADGGAASSSGGGDEAELADSESDEETADREAEA